MPEAIAIYLVVYGALALGHIAVQMLFGQLEHRRATRRAAGDATPRVTVVIPAYNEDPALLHRCLLSIDRQDYPEIEAIVVDDGSRNVADLLPVHDEFSSGRFRVVLQPDNSGKRSCQAVVFEQAMGDIVITVDSDTVLLPDAVRTIVRRFEDPDVGAVTGNVEAINQRQNLLTRLIAYRYWTAFNQERAAQSYFGVVLCASGPFSAYRRTIIEQVREAYINQRFLGRRCSFGDDRHLTNLVLGLGYDVVYDEGAVARTRVPSRVGEYLRQQTRWNKSFYREILWTAKFVRQRNPYMGLDLLLETVMPFALLVAIGLTVDQAIENPAGLWRYVAVVSGIGLARALYGLLRTHSPGFLLFTLYGFVHLFLLIPVRLYALATIGTTHWGTRSSDGDEDLELVRRQIVHARSAAGRAEAETAWARDVRRAVEGGESFLLHWQPVRDLRTGEVTHAEVLLRLRHRDAVLPPAEFLSIAEHHGLMGAVDERVTRETLALLAERDEHAPLRLEVNLSLDSISDPRFTTLVGGQLALSGVSPRRLVFAIPERVALAHPASAAAFARRVRALGCLVALDDFGSAYAAGDPEGSLRLLRGMSLDYVKLAREIVRPLPHSQTARDALRHLQRLARAAGVETVAVFVGDEETVRLLERERVEYAQGFHIGIPEPVATSLSEITVRAERRQVALVLRPATRDALAAT